MMHIAANTSMTLFIVEFLPTVPISRFPTKGGFFIKLKKYHLVSETVKSLFKKRFKFQRLVPAVSVNSHVRRIYIVYEKYILCIRIYEVFLI